MNRLRQLLLAKQCHKLGISPLIVAALVMLHTDTNAQQLDSETRTIGSADTTQIMSRQLLLDYTTTQISLKITLPPLDIESDLKLEETRRNRPPRIGIHRLLPNAFRGNLSSQIQWQSLDGRYIVGTMSVTSPTALAMRAGIYASMVQGGEIRFFSERKRPNNSEKQIVSQNLPVITRDAFRLRDGKPQMLWSPIVEGDTIGFEIKLPSDEALSTFSLRIERVSHIFASVESFNKYVPKLSCSNHIDVQCRASKFPRNGDSSVARIFFEKNNASYVCSGSLVTDNDPKTYVPYFITANHCVSTDEVAESIEAIWYYSKFACGNEVIHPKFQTTLSGADLLATSVAQDSTLLRLRTLPKIADVIFSGWNANAVRHPAEVFGLHYPYDGSDRYGGVMKYSGGKTVRNQDAHIDDFVVKRAIRTRWSEGVTEGGSSGSGLFLHGQQLIGVLSGGPDGCVNNHDFYGSFRHFFPKVKKWLYSTSHQ